MTLEDQLFAQSQFDLGWAGIIASGIKTGEELKHYLQRLDYLCQQISSEIKSEDNREKAKAVFIIGCGQTSQNGISVRVVSG